MKARVGMACLSVLTVLAATNAWAQVPPVVARAGWALITAGGAYVWGEVSNNYAAFAFAFEAIDPDAVLVYDRNGYDSDAHAWDSDPRGTYCPNGLGVAECEAEVRTDYYLHGLYPDLFSDCVYHNVVRIYNNDTDIKDKRTGGTLPPGAIGTGLEIIADLSAKTGGRTKTKMSVTIAQGRMIATLGSASQTSIPELKVRAHGGVEFIPDSLKWIPWFPPNAPVTDSTLESAYTWQDQANGVPSIRTLAIEAIEDTSIDFSGQLATALNAANFSDSAGFRNYDSVGAAIQFPDSVALFDENGSVIPWMTSFEMEGSDEGDGTTDVAPGGHTFFNALGPVRPNPGSRSFSAAMSLVADDRASLAVYDLTGRRVRDVFQGLLPRGHSMFRWQLPGSYPSGMYFLRLKTSRETLERAFIVLH